jgi:hypothetical protein
MSPISFPEANCIFGPPPGLTEAHVRPIPAHMSDVQGGSFDGSKVIVMAWVPDPLDLERLKNGGAIYVAMTGGVVPYTLTTEFQVAVSPA